MAPKFSDKRRAELQASSPKAPSPRLARVGKAELTAELWLVAYSQNAAFASGDLSETSSPALVGHI